MKLAFMILSLICSSAAFAETVHCDLNDKVLMIEVTDTHITLARLIGPSFVERVSPSNLSFVEGGVELSNDANSDANGTYLCN